MFDGCVPTELERLKEIYKAVWSLSVQLGAFAMDARRDGLPEAVYTRIDSLEEQSDKIRELFADVLTDDEQEELMR